MTDAIPERVARRAYFKAVRDPSGCHISTYSVASHGYAQIGWNDAGGRGMTLAHRAAWTYIHGPIPVGMTVDHKPTCTRPCVNVAHLRLLTNFENARRTFGRDWPLGECIHGHSNDELERYSAGGGRTRTRCRPCARQYQRRYRAKKAEAAKQ